MNAREFFYLVSNMRSAQKAYFKDRSQLTLKASIVLERQVDEEIARVKSIINENENENQ